MGRGFLLPESPGLVRMTLDWSGWNPTKYGGSLVFNGL